MDPVEIPDFMMDKSIYQLVMFTGLDVVNNTIHRNIFTSFTNRKKINYKMLTPENDVILHKPETKPLRSSHGILKRDWALKYLNHRPSLVVLFVELDWNHPSWLEKKAECESKVNSLRRSASCRDVRIILVLIQSGRSNADDPASRERAAELCSTCQLNDKHIFGFPLQDNVDAVTGRLETLFYDFGQQFYQNMIRKVRSRSVSANNINLIIRQQFKLGFLAEMRQDTHSALRPYKQAYQSCVDAEIAPAQLYEYLSVASLLNYKICELSFLHNVATEAVSQFRKHCSAFFNRVAGYYPSTDLAEIELMKWKSQQCHLFARLFADAVGKDLAAYAQQNPGISYQMAGNYCQQANELIVRKCSSTSHEEAKNVNKNILLMPDPQPGVTIYYGQRPWHVHQESQNLAFDPLVERAVLIALESGCKPNYMASVNMFAEAMQHFKIYRCGRMQKNAMLKIVDDYIRMRAFPKAAQSILYVINEFRKEGVLHLLKYALMKCLSVTYAMVDLNEYVRTLCQLMSPNLTNGSTNQPADNALHEQFTNTFHSLQNGIPPLIPEELRRLLSPLEANELHEKWVTLLQAGATFTTDLTSIDGHLKVGAAFLSRDESMISGNEATLDVAIQNLTSVDEFFPSCSVFVDERTNRHTPVPLESCKTLVHTGVQVPANSTVHLAFRFRIYLPSPARQENYFTIRQIHLDYGGPIRGCLQFDPTVCTIPPMLRSLRPNILSSEVGLHSLKVCPVVPQLSLRPLGDLTVLLGETACLSFALRNDEHCTLHNVTLMCRQLDTDDEQPEGYEFPALTFENENQSWQPRANADVAARLEPGQEVIFVLACRARCRFAAPLQIQIHAGVQDTTRWYDGLMERPFSFPAKGCDPFSLHCFLRAPNEETINFLMWGTTGSVDLTATTAFDLTVLGSEFVLEPDFEAFSESAATDDSTVSLGPGRQFQRRIRFRYLTKSTEKSHTFIGNLCVRWKREMSREPVRSLLPLGSYGIQSIPLLIESKLLSPTIVVRAPAVVEFVLENLSAEILDLKVDIERVEALMFHGFAEQSLRLFPGFVHSIPLKLVALSGGEMPFPRLKIACRAVDVDVLIQKYSARYLPTSLFVVLVVSSAPKKCATCVQNFEQYKQFREQQILSDLLKKLDLAAKPNVTIDYDNLPPIGPNNPRIKALIEETIREKKRARRSLSLGGYVPSLYESDADSKPQLSYLMAERAPWPLEDTLDIALFKVSAALRKKYVHRANLHLSIRRPAALGHLRQVPVRVDVYERFLNGTIGEKLANKYELLHGSKAVFPISIPLDGLDLQTWFQSRTVGDAEPWVGVYVEAVADDDEENLAFHPRDRYPDNMYLELELFEMPGRSRRAAAAPICNQHSNESKCCLYDLIIDFEKVGWDFVIAPKRYNAYICNGDCQFTQELAGANSPLVSTHGTMASKTKEEYYQCCHPKDYAGVTIVYVTEGNQMWIKEVPGMVARRCGCA